MRPLRLFKVNSDAGFGRIGAFSREGSLFFAVLALLFAVSFLTPIIFAAKVGGLFAKNDISQEFEDREIFPDSLVIATIGRFIRVVDSTHLDPEAGRDFIVSGWFNFRRLPSNGETMLLMTKFDAAAPSKSGYALALTRTGNIIRPTVYWRNVRGKGGWQEFSELTIEPKQWVMLSLSAHEGTLLGVHAVTFDEKGKARVQVLGGIEFAAPIIPESEVSLVLGSTGPDSFLGKIGPFGVISEPGLWENLREVINQLAKTPNRLPSGVSAEGLRLWSLGAKKDSSPANRLIEAVGGKGKKSETGSNAEYSNDQ